MKRQLIVWLLLALVLVLGPMAAQARYLNPNIGRFQTMDSYEGNNEDPPSLHKYSYCANDPVDRIDPRGLDYSLSGALTVMVGPIIFSQISNPTALAQHTAARLRQPASSFALSSQGLQLISTFEGFSPTIYQDTAGYDTIGFGHKLVSGERENFGNGITRDQGLLLLRTDVRVAERGVKSAVTIGLNQTEFDALVSFTFNLGGGALRSSTLLRKLNQGDYEGAAAEFPRWVYAGNTRQPGLVIRREKERILFRGELWRFRSELGFDPY